MMLDNVKAFKDECESKGVDVDAIRRKIEERGRYLAAYEPDEFWAYAMVMSKAMKLKIRKPRSRKK